MGHPDADNSGIFHRYVGLPFETMLLQGAPSKKVALGGAIGATLGLFPIMGTSIPLCFLAAHWLRVPQTVTHVVNYAMYPLQIPMILVFARLGERMFGAPRLSFSPVEIWALLKSNPRLFLDEYGHEVLYASAGWLVVAPFVFVLSYVGLLHLARRFRGEPDSTIPPRSS